MKIIKVLTDEWDIIGGLHNFYTIEEVDKYLKDNNLGIEDFKNIYYNYDEPPVGIAIDLDKTLKDIIFDYDYDFVFEGEFEEATKEDSNKYKLYRNEMDNENILQLMIELQNYNSRSVDEVYNTFKLIIENGDKFKKLFKQFNLK